MALDGLPARLDTRLLFPAQRRGHLNLHEWRADEWTPAVRAAGLAHRSPYALRHTYATFAIAAGVSLFELARFMGTSVEQIDKTYGHLLPDALDRTRAALDLFVSPHQATAASGPPEAWDGPQRTGLFPVQLHQPVGVDAADVDDARGTVDVAALECDPLLWP